MQLFYIRKYFMKLKKFLIVFLLPVLFLFAGCQKNEVLEVSKNLSTYNIDVVYLFDDISKVLLEWDNKLYVLINGEMIEIPNQNSTIITAIEEEIATTNTRIDEERKFISLVYVGWSENNYTDFKFP